MNVHALILAGGQGSRLGGVRKAELRVGNRTLFHRVSEELSGCATLLVATGPGPARPVTRGMALSDGDGPHGGPMAGMAAALRYLEGRRGDDDVLVTVAVDTPFLPRDYVQRLVTAVADAPAAYAAWNEKIYPTNSAWRLSALPATDALPDSPKALLMSLSASRIDWSDTEAEDPFVNVNRLSDLIALSRRGMAKGE